MRRLPDFQTYLDITLRCFYLRRKCYTNLAGFGIGVDCVSFRKTKHATHGNNLNNYRIVNSDYTKAPTRVKQNLLCDFLTSIRIITIESKKRSGL